MGSPEPRLLSGAPTTSVSTDSGILLSLSTAPPNLPFTFAEGEQAQVERPSQEGADKMDIDPAASSISPPRSVVPEPDPKRSKVSVTVEDDEEQDYRAWEERPDPPHAGSSK